jgi:NAD+ synthase
MDSLRQLLEIDTETESERISQFIKEQVLSRFKRKGAVVGLSGGIDSAVTAALCVEALGMDRVLGIILPEKESNTISRELGIECAKSLGIEYEIVDITSQLEAFDLYNKRDEIIKGIFPDFVGSCKFKVSMPQDLLERDRFNYRILTVQWRNGEIKEKRLSIDDWFRISAAQNVKQRTRMVNIYYHAEKHNYLVSGTTNRIELLLGFYVKYGDGGVDIEPISHLYKGQVYRLGEYLGVPSGILERQPSPDTYSLAVSDQEFFFCIPYETLDMLLYAWENDIPVSQVCSELNLSEEQVGRALRDFESKSNSSWHLRELPAAIGF